MKPSVLTFARFPDEESDFLHYLAKSGEVWARTMKDRPTCKPAPAAEFVPAHAAELTGNAKVNVYLGLRADVLAPVMRGSGDIDIFASCLVGYTRGQCYPGGEWAQSNLFFYRGFFSGNEFVRKLDSFLRWAGKVLDWARRHSPARVPVYRCNDDTRATARVAQAVTGGLKVWY
jgi:hypothetical protein